MGSTLGCLKSPTDDKDITIKVAITTQSKCCSIRKVTIITTSEKLAEIMSIIEKA
jgi:hypothetical protein